MAKRKSPIDHIPADFIDALEASLGMAIGMYPRNSLYKNDRINPNDYEYIRERWRNKVDAPSTRHSKSAGEYLNIDDSGNVHAKNIYGNYIPRDLYSLSDSGGVRSKRKGAKLM